MEPIIIDVDEITRIKAGQIVIDALREAGVCPYKSAKHNMVCELVRAWGHAEFTREQFVRAVGNVAIFCPSIRLDKTESGK